MAMYSVDSAIVGRGRMSAAAIDEWFGDSAPWDLGTAIIRACREWYPVVVNQDIVAGQVHLETGGWTSEYARERNNPAGLGAEDDDPDEALTFATVYEGIRAMVAHLLVYAVGEGPWAAVDLRYEDVKAAGWIGTAPRIGDLTRKWATDPEYGPKVVARTNALVRLSDARGWINDMEAEIPGFVWYPADRDHYTVGRGGARIEGGAQHYSAGSNSLGWLTTDSGKDNPKARVSAHLLVRKNATMDFRGWQLVRLRDTAWTTAYANPRTVGLEYEQLDGQAIPDSDYAVLGQTWADVTREVQRQNLGAIETIAGHKVWVNNPALVCPDGIDVDRVVREWKAALAAGATMERPEYVGDPDAVYVKDTGVWLQWGFKAFYQANPDALRWLGFPVEDETYVGGGLAYQRCERGVLMYDANGAAGWQVYVMPLNRYREFGLTT